MDTESESKTLLNSFKLTTRTIAQFVVWFGGASSGLALLLTACGFIVNYAYLDSLGVPRSAFDVKVSEHVLAGGNFIISLFQFTSLGLINILLNAWWLIGIVLLVGIICWRLCIKPGYRIQLFGLIYAGWMLFSLPQLSETNQINYFGIEITTAALVMMITAATMLAATYLFAELLVLREHDKFETMSARVSIILFGVLLLAICTMLPFLKGYYATERKHLSLRPFILNGETFKKIITSSELGCTEDIWCREWLLIQIGEKNMILRAIQDNSIIVIPKDVLPAYKLLPAQIVNVKRD